MPILSSRAGLGFYMTLHSDAAHRERVRAVMARRRTLRPAGWVVDMRHYLDEETGEFDYVCKIHGSMTGTVALAGGRPGLYLWLNADGSGRTWQTIDMQAHHNACYPREAIETALAAAQDGRIITLGIKPDHPATGYGYITVGGAIGGQATNCFEIEKFVEKPQKAHAVALVEEARSLWNAGVFIAYPEILLAELEVHQPDIVRVCKSAISHSKADLDFLRADPEGFEQLPSISIDYAVMEHTKIGGVVPIDVKWSDVGSWMALWELLDKDEAMNAVRGPVHPIDSRGVSPSFRGAAASDTRRRRPDRGCRCRRNSGRTTRGCAAH